MARMIVALYLDTNGLWFNKDTGEFDSPVPIWEWNEVLASLIGASEYCHAISKKYENIVVIPQEPKHRDCDSLLGLNYNETRRGLGRKIDRYGDGFVHLARLVASVPTARRAIYLNPDALQRDLIQSVRPEYGDETYLLGELISSVSPQQNGSDRYYLFEEGDDVHLLRLAGIDLIDLSNARDDLRDECGKEVPIVYPSLSAALASRLP